MTCHTSEQEHGHEHDADRQGRHESGYGDLLCAIQNRLLQRFALLEMLADVLDRNRGVVDQDTDRQRETA